MFVIRSVVGFLLGVSGMIAPWINIFGAFGRRTKMANRKTRRNSRKASRRNNAFSRKAQHKSSRKSTRKAQAGGKSDWNKKVMEVYRELKRKNPATRLGDAMREASRRYKK
jgi:hypothetical protein